MAMSLVKKVASGCWICSSCRFSSTNNCSLVRHSQIFHNSNDDVHQEVVKLSFVWIEGLKCHLCSFFATSQSLMDDHMLSHKVLKSSQNIGISFRSRKNDFVIEKVIYQSDAKRRLTFEENNNNSNSNEIPVKNVALKRVECSLCKLFEVQKVDSVKDLEVKNATIIKLRKQTVTTEASKDTFNVLTRVSNSDDLKSFNCTKCHFNAESKELGNHHFQNEHQILKVNDDYNDYLVENRKSKELKNPTLTKQISIILNGVQCRKCKYLATSHDLLKSHKCIRSELNDLKLNNNNRHDRKVETGNASKTTIATIEETKISSLDYCLFKAKQFSIILTKFRLY
jgi:hypothetical protein